MGLVIQPSDKRLGQVAAGTQNSVRTATTQQAQVVSGPGGVVISMGAPINNTPAGTPGPSWAYEFSTSTANADPGPAKFAFNNATYADVTEIYVDWVDLEGGVVSNQLLALPTGATLQVASGSQSAVFTIIGRVNGDNYVTMPVTYVSSADTPFSNGAVCELSGTSRVGMQVFDNAGMLALLIDAYGAHLFNDQFGAAQASYAGEMFPSAWTPLTLSSGISFVTGGPVPSVRTDPGGVVRLAGVLLNDSGSTISAGATLAALPAFPSGLSPTWTVSTPVGPSGDILSITGTMSINANLAAGGTVSLDGVTWGMNYA